MANVTLQMLKAVTGYGNVNDVITVPQTAQTDAMIVNGEAAVYSGPVTPTVLPGPIARYQSTTAIAVTLAAPSGQDVVVVLTAAPAVPTLPTAVNNTTHYTIKNNSGSAITPVTTGGQTIDGAAPAAIANKGTLKLLSDGANWIIV